MSVYNDIHKMRLFYIMSIDTQLLIIELLKQELRRSDRLPTKHYYREIEDALHDFIQHTKTLGTTPNRRK